jgi:hypothetical protein
MGFEFARNGWMGGQGVGKGWARGGRVKSGRGVGEGWAYYLLQYIYSPCKCSSCTNIYIKITEEGGTSVNFFGFLFFVI